MTVVFVRLGFRSDYSERHRFAMEKILPMFGEVKSAATFLAEVRA